MVPCDGFQHPERERPIEPDAIERQLAHRESNQVRAAYNRAEYLDERRRMMQWYGEYLRQCWQGSVPCVA